MVANVFAARISVWRTCMVVLLLVGLFACQTAASTSITSVVVANKPDCVTVSVHGTTALRMSPIQSSRYVGFQFAGRLTAKGGFVSIHSGRIYCVRYSRFSENPPMARVVLNTSGTLDYSTEWSSDRTQVTISVWKFGARPTARVPKSNAAQQFMAMAPVSDLPVLPPAEISGPQGSDPGTPDPEPVRLAAAPMRVAGPASSAPISIAQVTSLTARSTALVQPVRIARVPDAPVRMAQATIAPVVLAAAEKRVSLNFLSADINDVLKALASQSGQNIVASKDVKGEVTVSLSDVTLEEALDYVAKLSGFGYIKSNGTYLVGTKDSIKTMSGGDAPSAASTEVVPVSFTNCNDLLSVVKAQYPDVQATKVGMQSGKSGATDPGGSIVLVGSAASVAAAKRFIEEIDAPGGTDQLIYKVRYIAADKLAAMLRKLIPGVNVEGLGITAGASGGGASGGAAAGGAGAPTPAGGTDLDVPRTSGLDQMTAYIQQSPMNAASLDNLSRTLVITGGKTAVAQARALTEALDTKSPQIKIDAKITSITATGEKKLGLSWNWGTFGMSEVSPSHWQRQPVNFGATLEALITEGNGTLLAAPSLMCLEGKPAQFFVGEQIRYVTSVSVGNNGAPTVTTEPANVGVQLTVVGTIGADGCITLNLHPEVSVLRLTPQTQAGISLPTISRRYTDHVVRVKNGQTIVIGGLISDNELDTLSKVPILGDLPFLGQLFRHREKTKDHSEVVIFITASVVAD